MRVLSGNTGFSIDGISFVNTSTNGNGIAMQIQDSSGWVVGDVAAYRYGTGIEVDSIATSVADWVIQHLEHGPSTAGVSGTALLLSTTATYAIAGGVVMSLHALDSQYVVRASGGGGFARNTFVSVTGEGCGTIWDTSGMSGGPSTRNRVLKMHSDAPVSPSRGIWTSSESSLNLFGYFDSVDTINNQLQDSDYTEWQQGWRTWTPSWTGFSAAPSGVTARWQRVGNVVTAVIRVGTDGTSNGVGLTVTLPVAAKNTAACAALGVGVDGGTSQSTPSRVDTTAGSNSATVYRTPAGANWTASGGKSTSFTITYEAN